MSLKGCECETVLDGKGERGELLVVEKTWGIDANGRVPIRVTGLESLSPL